VVLATQVLLEGEKLVQVEATIAEVFLVTVKLLESVRLVLVATIIDDLV